MASLYKTTYAEMHQGGPSDYEEKLQSHCAMGQRKERSAMNLGG